ncbi:PRKR-interacting protein 1 homolog [Centruroides sculpturatus]|uniref:PRKR-interacting protein 1 homolog n=1 Tax=Centruroides sculpturatus TaxID=218467 RepID=UPI000C6D717E|nr:PRKR-interacting protein 1 homolog [Centruroides sculpturatus]
MDESKKNKERNVIVPKTCTDLQRMRLERLMENPDKPVIIPDPPKEKKSISVPEFVRNVMGSSAGAGSGEFHVYRHLRRKEYARQKYIDEKAAKERLDVEFHRKIEENKRKAELKTAKKRAKR